MISHKTTILVDRQLDLGAIGSLELRLEMCMGMGFPMGPGIPWDKTQNWEMGMGMGNHLSGNGNYLHSYGNLFPKVLICCDELIKLLVLYLPDVNAYCAEFADYRNVIYYSDNK